MNFITNNLWKIATGGAAIVAFALSALLMATYFENRDLVKQRNELSQSISDPQTGYIARLTQARANEEVLKVTVARQTEAYRELSETSKAQLAESERQLRLAQQGTRAMEKQLAGFLATKPQGATLEERIRDIDERAMKEFVK